MHDPDGYVISQLPNVTGALNVGSVQIDSNRDLIYAQMEDADSKTPVLQVSTRTILRFASDCCSQENLSGKSVLSSDGSTMYSVSESGVTVLPVGQLELQPRVFASKQDLTFRGNFCDRNIATQEVTITSNGASADFKLTSDNPSVRISPFNRRYSRNSENQRRSERL